MLHTLEQIKSINYKRTGFIGLTYIIMCEDLSKLAKFANGQNATATRLKPH